MISKGEKTGLFNRFHKPESRVRVPAATVDAASSPNNEAAFFRLFEGKNPAPLPRGEAGPDFSDDFVAALSGRYICDAL